MPQQPDSSTRGIVPIAIGRSDAVRLRAWRNGVFAIFFISGLSLASWMSRVPAVRDSLGLTTAGVGILIFGLAAGSVLGLGAAVWLLSRFGARRAILYGIAATAVGLAVVGAGSTVFSSAAVVFGGLVLVGLGMGSVDVMMNVEGAAVERESGRTLMPFMHACFSLGTVAGAMLGVGASAVGLAVSWHLAIVALLVLATAIVSVPHLPPKPGGDPSGADRAGAPANRKDRLRDRLRDRLAVWTDRRILLIGLIVLGMTFAEGSANDWLALASVDGHGLDNTEGAVVFGVFVAAMTMGRVLGGPVIDRLGRVAVLRASAGLGIIGLVLFLLAPGGWLLYGGTALWGLGASLGFPVGMSAAADDAAHAPARVSAVAMIGYFSFLVGPPVLGLLGQSWGILNALALVLALLVVAGLAAPAARPQRPRTPPPAQRPAEAPPA